jgi:hypothetical protein
MCEIICQVCCGAEWGGVGWGGDDSQIELEPTLLGVDAWADPLCSNEGIFHCYFIAPSLPGFLKIYLLKGPSSEMSLAESGINR